MQSVLVTDFDGTITDGDFYILAVERLLKPEDLAPGRNTGPAASPILRP